MKIKILMLIIFIFLVVIWISIYVNHEKSSCNISYHLKTLDGFGKRIIYTWNCFDKKSDINEWTYQQDYCIYNAMREKWSRVLPTFFENKIVISDVIHARKSLANFYECWENSDIQK